MSGELVIGTYIIIITIITIMVFTRIIIAVMISTRIIIVVMMISTRIITVVMVFTRIIIGYYDPSRIVICKTVVIRTISIIFSMFSMNMNIVTIKMEKRTYLLQSQMTLEWQSQ